MKKILLTFVFALGLFSFPTDTFAVGCTGTGNCYWVGGTGSSDEVAHWATTDGGATTGGAPNVNDNCNFTANSGTSSAAYTFTIPAAGLNCKDFIMAGPGSGNNITWAGSGQLGVVGNMSLTAGSADITRTFTGVLLFASTATGKTIDLNGVTLASAIDFNGSGGGWAFTNHATTTGAVTLTTGTVDTNGKFMTWNSFTSTGASARTLTLGTTTLNLTAGGACWNVGASLTLTSSTSHMRCLSTSSGTWAGGGLSYATVTITQSVSALRTLTISGANTFANLTTLATASGGYLDVALSGNQTVTGTFTASSSFPSLARIFVRSNTLGTARTLSAGAVSLGDVDFRNITASGAAIPFTGIRLGNASANSNITFEATSTKYYVGNTGNWNAATAWATSSGGTGRATAYPLPQDTAIFDTNSFSAASQTVTINAASCRISTVDFSGMTNRANITWEGVVTASEIYGSITLPATTTFSFTGTAAWTFLGGNTKTITSNGKSWLRPIIINSLGGGTVKPTDGLSLTGATTAGLLTLTAGTFDLNGQTVSATRFSGSGSTARTLMGTGGGTLRVTDTTTATVFDMTTVTNLTLTRSTWGIEQTGSTTNVRTLNLGTGISYPTITYRNTVANGGIDIVTSGTSTVKSIVYTGTSTQTIRRTAATSIIIEDNNGFPSGNVGNLLSIRSITTAVHTWYKSSGTICSDYLSLSTTTAQIAGVWYAGAGSTNVGGNTGWTFTACPSSSTPSSLISRVKQWWGKILISNGKIKIQ